MDKYDWLFLIIMALAIVITYFKWYVPRKRKNTLEYWEKELNKANIIHSKRDDELFAELNNRDEEGHHYLLFTISKNRKGKIKASLIGMGGYDVGLEPNDAFSKFKMNKDVFFSNC